MRSSSCSSFNKAFTEIGQLVSDGKKSLIIFGRGAGGPHIVKEAPLAGLDMPFKALAWEDAQGKVWVSYTNGSYMDQRYSIKGAASYVKNINETIEKLISEALK